MKPITYWVQNDAINQLVERYGADLTRMPQVMRRELIALLAVPEEWDWSGSEPHPLDDVYPLVENLTRYEKDKLISAIAASLIEQGNPWLEAAGKMVSLEQAHKKTGTHR